MFSLSEIFDNAQGGKAAENLATQFGLSPEQVDSAVKALIPALSMAFLAQLKEPGALGGLVSHLADGQHTATFSSADAHNRQPRPRKAMIFCRSFSGRAIL